MKASLLLASIILQTSWAWISTSRVVLLRHYNLHHRPTRIPLAPSSSSTKTSSEESVLYRDAHVSILDKNLIDFTSRGLFLTRQAINKSILLVLAPCSAFQVASGGQLLDMPANLSHGDTRGQSRKLVSGIAAAIARGSRSRMTRRRRGLSFARISSKAFDAH
jgi:hypothetical protein